MVCLFVNISVSVLSVFFFFLSFFLCLLLVNILFEILLIVSVFWWNLRIQDDESLKRWKEQLLGTVDLESVGGLNSLTTTSHYVGFHSQMYG